MKMMMTFFLFFFTFVAKGQISFSLDVGSTVLLPQNQLKNGQPWNIVGPIKPSPELGVSISYRKDFFLFEVHPRLIFQQYSGFIPIFGLPDFDDTWILGSNKIFTSEGNLVYSTPWTIGAVYKKSHFAVGFSFNYIVVKKSVSQRIKDGKKEFKFRSDHDINGNAESFPSFFFKYSYDITDRTRVYVSSQIQAKSYFRAYQKENIAYTSIGISFKAGTYDD